MDKIQLGIFNSNIQLQKLVKYGLDIIESTSNSTQHNIEIKLLEPHITNKCDLAIINLLYKDIVLETNITDDFYIMLEENFKGFNNFIVIVVHDEYFNIDEIEKIFNSKFENIQTKYNIDITHIYLEKAVEYLSVIRDDIKSIDTNIIDIILKDELGKQKYRLLDSDEKKNKEIKNLIKNSNLVEEWMSSVGFDKLLDVFEKKIIIPYNNIIQKHCKTSIEEIINYISINNISITTQEQIIHVVETIKILLDGIHIFNTYTTNTDIIDNINDNEPSKNLLSVLETSIITININRYIIEVSTNFDIIKQFGYDFFESYLNLIKKYTTAFEIDDKKINSIILDLMKSKMMHKFNEELFNELSSLNIKLNENEKKNEDNLNNIFLECVGIWIKNDPNNFYELIKYSKKTNQLSQIKLVISKFIEHMELLTNDNNDYLDKNNLLIEQLTTIDSSKLIDTFKIILDSKDIKNKEDTFNFDTIQISKLMYIITNVVMNENNINKLNQNPFIKSTTYIFDKYICDYINYNDEKHNLFIHNIYYNYSNIVNNLGSKVSSELIQFTEFEKIHNVFSHILKILFDFIGYNKVFYDSEKDEDDKNESSSNNESSNNESSKIINNNIQSNKKIIISDYDSEKDTYNNSESDNNSDSDDDLLEDEQIEKIYGFIKKTMSGKHLNQQTLKNISVIYWNKTQDYERSIKLFESDMINKKFTKIYKENNKTK